MKTVFSGSVAKKGINTSRVTGVLLKIVLILFNFISILYN